MKLFCIADEDTVRAFRLAGVSGLVVTTAQEASAAIEQAIGGHDYGIVILTEKVAAGIRQQVDTVRLEQDKPLVVEIPGPDGLLPGRKSLHQFVEEAIGIKLERRAES